MLRSHAKLKQHLNAIYGERATQWWDELPAMLDKLALSHQLTLLKPFKNLSFNYVLPVLGPQKESWVLKLCVPHPDFIKEIRALQHYNGRGCVRLIDARPDDGWMMIERCLPGTRLVDINSQQESIIIAISVMQKLWKPLEHPEGFPLLKEWLASLKNIDENPSVKKLLAKPLQKFVKSRTKELLSNQGEQILLHGDFHHYNVLQHQDDWLAIDPKGVVGEREFEIGAFLRNPLSVIEKPPEKKKIARKLDLMIELTGFERRKVLSWSIIQAVLCVCWYCEDHMHDKAKQLAVFAECLYGLH